MKTAWYWWWDLNPQILVPKTNAYAIRLHQHNNSFKSANYPSVDYWIHLFIQLVNFYDIDKLPSFKK